MEDKKEIIKEEKQGNSIITKLICTITLVIAFTIVFQNTYDEILRITSNTIVGSSIEVKVEQGIDPFDLLSEEEKRRILEEITSNE